MLYANSSNMGAFRSDPYATMGGGMQAHAGSDAYSTGVYDNRGFAHRVDMMKERVLDLFLDKVSRYRKPIMALCLIAGLVTMKQSHLSKFKAAVIGTDASNQNNFGVGGGISTGITTSAATGITTSARTASTLGSTLGSASGSTLGSTSGSTVGSTSVEPVSLDASSVQRNMVGSATVGSGSINTATLCDKHCGQAGVQVAEFAQPMRDYGKVKAFSGPITVVQSFEGSAAVATAVRQKSEGGVLVVDGGGSLRVALLNNGMAQSAKANGWAGIIIYGCVRNVDKIEKVSLGIKAYCSHPRMGEAKGGGAVDKTLFGEVEFVTGDYAYVDEDGVLLSESNLESSDAAASTSVSSTGTSAGATSGTSLSSAGTSLGASSGSSSIGTSSSTGTSTGLGAGATSSSLSSLGSSSSIGAAGSLGSSSSTGTSGSFGSSSTTGTTGTTGTSGSLGNSGTSGSFGSSTTGLSGSLGSTAGTGTSSSFGSSGTTGTTTGTGSFGASTSGTGTGSFGATGSLGSSATGGFASQGSLSSSGATGLGASSSGAAINGSSQTTTGGLTSTSSSAMSAGGLSSSATGTMGLAASAQTTSQGLVGASSTAGATGAAYPGVSTQTQATHAHKTSSGKHHHHKGKGLEGLKQRILGPIKDLKKNHEKLGVLAVIFALFAFLFWKMSNRRTYAHDPYGNYGYAPQGHTPFSRYGY